MSQSRLAKPNKFRRDAWLEVDLEHLEFNLKQIHEWVKTPLIPVIKADAYGHGASILAPVLEAYDCVHSFAVASLDEALILREAQIKKPIMVLGISPAWAFEAAVLDNIELTIVDYKSAVDLNNLAHNLNKSATVHIKIDTGMNRIGFKAYDKEAFIKTINDIKNLEHIKIASLFSHFSSPDDREVTGKQLNLFNELTESFDIPKHIASSGAARLYPETRKDLVRTGIELYGLENQGLKPLMSLYSRITFLKDIKAGETVSYQGTWQANKDTKIATLPLGYADGVPRSLSNRMQAYCQSQEIQQVGNITMDQLMFDVGGLDGVKVGDIVELIGPNISAHDWADKLGTISYEIVTSLSLRLPKTYTRKED